MQNMETGTNAQNGPKGNKVTNPLKSFTATEASERVATPQRKRTPGRTDEVKNSAGGYVFPVEDKQRLERFLILGTTGGTYYVGEQKLTKENVKFLRDLIKRDEALVLETVIDVSVNGRAYKNSPAIFALAVLLSEGSNKAATRAAVPQVCRTGTHIMEFAAYLNDLGGWGRAKRGAIADWFLSFTPDKLAYQAVKYRSRSF